MHTMCPHILHPTFWLLKHAVIPNWLFHGEWTWMIWFLEDYDLQLFTHPSSKEATKWYWLWVLIVVLFDVRHITKWVELNHLCMKKRYEHESWWLGEQWKGSFINERKMYQTFVNLYHIILSLTNFFRLVKLVNSSVTNIDTCLPCKHCQLIYLCCFPWNTG